MKKLLIAILAASVLAVGAQSGNDLFQKALVMERTEGNLPEAIKLYQRIVDRYAGDRKLAANALMQMAQCQERLGQAEARKTYERLVRDYSDQTEQVQAARSRLTLLAQTPSRASAAATTVRKVWSGSGIAFEGEISPDGRYISFVDWDTGDLAICDLETGAKRRLTNKGPWKDPLEYAYTSRWAPDGKQIVYEWYDPRGSELRLVNIDNPKSRLFYRSRQWEWVDLFDWSSDGKEILASDKGGILLISVKDSTARVLKTTHLSYHGTPRLSRDGRYVAVDFPQRESGAEHDIYVLSVESGREAALVSHPADDWILGWSPDGKWLLFASDRSGTLGIWAIQVVDGAAKGDPQIIKAGLPEILPMGVTRQGSFCYGQSSRNENVYVAKLDPRTGKATGPPEEMTQRFEGLCGNPAYSRDGRHLAYACSRGPILGFRGRNILRIRSLETGEDRELSTAFASIFYPRWLPDGRFLLIAGHNDQGGGTYKIDTQTLEMKLLFRDAAAGEPSPDGKGLFYAKREKENNLCRILFRDFEKGEERELYRGSVAESYNVSLSRDGRWLAFLNRTNPRVLRILPAEGGKPRELFRFELVGDANILMTWTADGKYILFSKPVGEGPDGYKQEWDLWRVPAAGGEAQRLGVGVDCEDPSAHPDGQQIAFSSSHKRTLSDEVWILENFLPLLQIKR